MSNVSRRFPYRYEENVLVFARKPGTTAEYRPNPMDAYGFNIPPLSARILRYSQYATIDPEDQSLANIIINNIDSKGGVGEIHMNGSVSWSNINQMKSILNKVYR